MHSFSRHLARYVRDSRRANRLTQAQLAEFAGVGRRFVSDLENAKATLRLDKVCSVLGVFGKCLGLVERPRQEVSTWDAEDE